MQIEYPLNVEFDPKLDEAPYRVDFDPDKCLYLFSSQGLTPEQINRIKIKIQRNAWYNFGNISFGSYQTLNRNLSVYTDVAWDIYNERFSQLNFLQNELFPHWLDSLMYPKSVTRAVEEIEKMGPENARAGVRRMFLDETNERFNRFLLHEAKHAADFTTPIGPLGIGVSAVFFLGIYRLIGDNLASIRNIDVTSDPFQALLTYLPSSVLAYGITYLVNPLEIRARRAEKEYKNDPNLTGIISLYPR